MSEKQYDLGLDECTQLVDELRKSLEDLQDFQVATAALGKLDILLRALEACISKRYDAGMNLTF